MARYQHPLTKVIVSVADGKAMPGFVALDDDGSGGEDGGYSQLKVADLREEIDHRNTNRAEDDQLSREGRKPDLIARLVADDAANGDQ